jgi:leucyl aminopeptidase (aminopeptidase T)
VKIVLDATVLIRAHNRSKALARRLVHEILEHGHRLVLSNEMIGEVVKVLRYPDFQNLYGLTEADLLECAQNGATADILCTHDRDFYEDAAVLSFCAARGIEVCYGENPHGEALGVIMRHNVAAS